MNATSVRLTLIGLALGVLLAVVIAPQTRWLVRLQALTTLRLYHPLLGENTSSYLGVAAEDARRIQRVAAHRPDDFDLQYAQVIDGEGKALGSARSVAALRGLEARFPNQPALYANILRYAANGLHWNRTEEIALFSPPQPAPAMLSRPNDPAALAAFDRDAATGERLDPNNAYFPTMRAVGLFLAHRDTDGLAAVLRADRGTEWREYVPEEIEARWRLHEAAFGDPGALPRTVTAYETLFPEYTLLRALARLLRDKAVEAERAGRYEQGLQLREALRHYGDLMRVHSTSFIGSLVGIAITMIATDDPGGVVPPKPPTNITSDQLRQRRLAAYCAYVTRLGHPEAAARARAEEEAWRRVQAMNGPDAFSNLTTHVVSLTVWWLADLAVLANILWLLMFGGLASGCARTPWANGSREGKRTDEVPVFNHHSPPERPPAFLKNTAVAALSVAVAFLLADFSLHLFDLPNWLHGILNLIEELCFLLAVFALPPTIAVYLMRHGPRLPHFSRFPSASGIRTALLAGACVYGICALAWWQSGSIAELAENGRFLTTGVGSEVHNEQPVIQWLSLAAALSVPLLLTTIFAIAARIRCAPAAVGLTRGFALAALPVACGLLLVYGGLLLGTVHQERVVNEQVWHSSHDEGPYLATQAGQTWPGPVR